MQQRTPPRPIARPRFVQRLSLRRWLVQRVFAQRPFWRRLFLRRLRWRRLLALGLAIGAVGWLLSITQNRPESPSPCGERFQDRASFIPLEGVKDAGGLTVADVDGDGTQDIIVASGGDTAPGHITIRFGDSHLPIWQSEDEDYNTRVITGDLNKDGILDLVVALFAPPNGQPASGAAKIYLSQDGQLPRRPTVLLPLHAPGLYSPEVALGDANGDGYLDLAVATLLSGQDTRTPQLIYFNRGGSIDPEAPWTSDTLVQATALRFLDLDDDGLMDLLITAPTRTWGWLFKGQFQPDGSVGIARQASSWSLSGDFPKSLFTVDLDVDASPPDRARSLFVPFTNHYCAASDCTGFVARFDIQGTMHWISQERGMASALRVADTDGDGESDVVVGYWSPGQCSQPESCPEPGPLYVYCGSEQGPVRHGQRLARQQMFLTERLLLVDLNGDSTVSRTHVVSGNDIQGKQRFVVTLPFRNVMHINSVRRNGAAVPVSHYAVTPGNHWVAFREPITSEDRVEIAYSWASKLDIVIADETRAGVIPVVYHR